MGGMNSAWLFENRFPLFGHHLSIAGMAGFGLAFLIGLAGSGFLQSERMRRWLTRFGLEKGVVAFVTACMSLAVFVTAVLIGLNIAGLPINWAAPLPGIGLSLTGILRLVVMVVLVFWASSLAKRFLLNRFLSRSGMDRAMQYTVSQITGYVVLVLGCFVVAQNAGIDLSALTVFAGAVGVGVGLGLQEIASNFLSGLIILAERPIAIGDRVEVGSAAGAVRQIRARSTTIVTNDNIALIVPNSYFVKETVTNWSVGDPKVRFRIPIGVAYGSDVEKVCACLIEVAREHPAALANPAPTVFFDAFGDSSLNFQLVVWSNEMSDRPRRFRSDLNFAIEKKLRAAGVEIPFPQRDVHFRNAIPMESRTAPGTDS